REERARNEVVIANRRDDDMTARAGNRSNEKPHFIVERNSAPVDGVGGATTTESLANRPRRKQRATQSHVGPGAILKPRNNHTIKLGTERRRWRHDLHSFGASRRGE